MASHPCFLGNALPVSQHNDIQRATCPTLPVPKMRPPLHFLFGSPTLLLLGLAASSADFQLFLLTLSTGASATMSHCLCVRMSHYTFPKFPISTFLFGMQGVTSHRSPSAYSILLLSLFNSVAQWLRYEKKTGASFRLNVCFINAIKLTGKNKNVFSYLFYYFSVRATTRKQKVVFALL